jgi:hypothetical protein
VGLPGYRLDITSSAAGETISAVAADGTLICGAYRPVGIGPDWRLSVGVALTTLAGVPQPRKAHAGTRDTMIRWIDLLASLYVQASASSELADILGGKRGG